MDATALGSVRRQGRRAKPRRGAAPGHDPAVHAHPHVPPRLSGRRTGQNLPMGSTTGTPCAAGHRAAGGVRTLPLWGLLDRTLGARDDSRPAAAVELHGDADGPPTRLPTGVLVQRRRIGDRRVSTAEFLQAVRGISLLPKQHQQALARAGVPIYLVPSAGLEDGLLGATTIVQDTDGSNWRPTLVRVAVSANRRGTEATAEIAQHEIGHVIAVLTGQDRSEAAAEAYARRY